MVVRISTSDPYFLRSLVEQPGSIRLAVGVGSEGGNGGNGGISGGVLGGLNG